MDVLIDTDPGMGTLGCDPKDGFAIALALASPELTVRAITCVQGNVPLRHSYANAAHLLELLRRSRSGAPPARHAPPGATALGRRARHV